MQQSSRLLTNIFKSIKILMCHTWHKCNGIVIREPMSGHSHCQFENVKLDATSLSKQHRKAFIILYISIQILCYNLYLTAQKVTISTFLGEGLASPILNFFG